MKRSRSIAIALGTAAVAALSIFLWRATGAHDAPSRDTPSRGAAAEARNEVAYPPAYPSSPELGSVIRPEESEFDLCGYGRVDPEQIPAFLEGEADSAILRAADELTHNADDRGRALGLATRAWIAAQAADRIVTNENPVACRETALCDELAAAAYRRAAEPSLEALTRLAMATRDPDAYVIALRACRSIMPESPPAICDAVSVEQWAQLDPDNALALLLTARNAYYRKDVAAFEDALQRASRAKAFDRRAIRYGDILASADIRQDPARTLVLRKLTMAEARWDPVDFFSNFAIFFNYCAKPDEPGRRDLCNNLAEVLTEHSPDRLGLEIGGMFVRAPNEKSRAAWAENGAILTELSVARANAENLTCKASARTEQWLRGTATYGELGYVRQLIARRKPP